MSTHTPIPVRGLYFHYFYAYVRHADCILIPGSQAFNHFNMTFSDYLHINKMISMPFCTGKSYGVEVVWMDSTADEANLWQRMLQCDGEWVEDVLPLRMLVVAKSMSK